MAGVGPWPPAKPSLRKLLLCPNGSHPEIFSTDESSALTIPRSTHFFSPMKPTTVFACAAESLNNSSAGFSAGIMSAIRLTKMSQATPFSTNPFTPSTSTQRGIRHGPSKKTPLAAADAASAAACLRVGAMYPRFRCVGLGTNCRLIGFSTVDFMDAIARTKRLSIARSGSLSGIPERVAACLSFENGDASSNDRPPSARLVSGPPCEGARIAELTLLPGC